MSHVPNPFVRKQAGNSTTLIRCSQQDAFSKEQVELAPRSSDVISIRARSIAQEQIPACGREDGSAQDPKAYGRCKVAVVIRQRSNEQAHGKANAAQ